MNYAPEIQISKARNIARSAQQKIRNKTGMKVSILLYARGNELKTQAHMLNIIALALDLSPECYTMRSRMRDIAELRFIGAYFLRMNFPNITLHQIAELFGGLDHTSIISGLTRAQNLIYTEDPRFMTKYYMALKSVNEWLRREESGYASANSA